MDLKNEINKLENKKLDGDFVILKGEIPILFSAPHTMQQKRDDGTIKLSEPYTKAISLFLNQYCKTYSFIKNRDTGIDSNKYNYDEYNIELKRLVEEENIKLVIDLHGASITRDFDIEFGTLNNLSADYSTIRELEDAFEENGIIKIVHNDPFKGGAITQNIYSLDNVDIIQLEINRKFRDLNNIENMEKLLKALIRFVNQFYSYINN